MFRSSLHAAGRNTPLAFSKSISDQVAPRASPLRAAVKTRTGNTAWWPRRRRSLLLSQASRELPCRVMPGSVLYGRHGREGAVNHVTRHVVFDETVRLAPRQTDRIRLRCLRAISGLVAISVSICAIPLLGQSDRLAVFRFVAAHVFSYLVPSSGSYLTTPASLVCLKCLLRGLFECR